MSTGGQEIEKIIVQALETVREPSGKNLVEAGVITGIQGEDAVLQVTCRDQGWPDPIRQRVEREAKAALQAALPQLQDVKFNWQPAGQQPLPTGAPGGETLAVKHVVAVGSGKGGVGKSTIAASLAYGLKHRGKTVGIMDADVYGPSIPHMLGISGQPGASSGRYVPLETDGIKVMSMGFLVREDQAVIWRGPMLHKAVRDFLYMVDWGPLDYLIVDLPPGTGDVVLSLSQQLPLTGGIIVCTPQDVALLDARKALNMLQTVKIPCRGLVENMSYFNCPHCGERSEIFGHGGAQRWAESAGIPFLGRVPINLAMRINGDEGHLRDNFADDNIVRNDLLSIADKLDESVRSSGIPAGPSLEII